MSYRGRGARFAKVRRKPDANHGEIALAFRRCGASVIDLSSVGGNCPDLLVGYRGRDVLVEIKTATGELEPGQADFAATWKGAPIVVVRSPAEALMVLGVRLDT